MAVLLILIGYFLMFPANKIWDLPFIEAKYWIPFFQDSNNIYVNDLAKRARRSSTHSSIINQKITFALGKEFLFKVDGEQKSFEELDNGFQDWFMEVNPEGDTLRDVFKELMQSFVITGNC